MRTKSKFGLVIVLVVVLWGLAWSRSSADPSAPVLNPANFHYYQVIFETSTWDGANTLASAMTFNNCKGHLATITSAVEDDFLFDTYGGALTGTWLGGYQDEGVGPADYGWQWITGEPFTYSNWGPGEPNDGFGPGSEQVMEYGVTGTWNDLPRWNDVYLGGFVVEYDCPVFNPENLHYYEVVVSPWSWDDAKVLANSMTFNHCSGHLATITSQSENSFLIDTYGAALKSKWLGGYQDDGVYPADYGWKWVTGEPFAYTSWPPGEPNDAFGPGSEQVLEYQSTTIGAWNDLPRLDDFHTSGFVVEYDCVVQIDIKPGSDPNSINCTNQNAVIPVAILTTDSFDATTVDHHEVQFEGGSELHSNRKTGEPLRHEKDVDDDGDTDLVFHYLMLETSLTCLSEQGTLTGLTYDGDPIVGTDSVNMIDGK